MKSRGREEESAAEFLARELVEAILERGRAVFDEYSSLKRFMRENFGCCTYFVGEVVVCRKISKFKEELRMEFPDGRTPFMFAGVAFEKGLPLSLPCLRKGKFALRKVRDFVLAGKSDFVLKKNGVAIPVEVKLSLTKTLPKDSYYLQTALYAFLYDAPSALLFYVSSKFRIIEIKNVLTEDDVETLIDIWRNHSPLFPEECRQCMLHRIGLCRPESLLSEDAISARKPLYVIVQKIKREARELNVCDFAEDYIAKKMLERLSKA